jgi:segregation and condensation protein A
MQFQVDIEQYAGPLDLLLHIVRREELDLTELPIAKIVDQYWNYVEVLVELDIDDVGEFLEIASLLIEWKAKRVVPSQTGMDLGGSPESIIEETQTDLVQRLIEYQRVREASSRLEEQGRRWQLRYSRLSDDLPARRSGTDQQPIESLEIWDLVSAFGRILRERQPPATTEVIYDETPIGVYMSKIHVLLSEQKRVELSSLFESGMHKSALVGMFLATLELTRHYGVSTEQNDPYLPLYLVAGEGFHESLQHQHPES